VVKLAEKEEVVYAAVGVHPNHITSWDASILDELGQLAEHPKVVAIGEIGLDFYRDRTPKPLQRKVFREQLTLAAELGLPVIIHDREAHDEVIPILEEWAPDLGEKPGVLHSYSGNISQAEAVLEAGYYLGITGPVTFKNALEMQEVAQLAPQDRLLIETDGPYLAPHPYRGKRNEPAHVQYVADKIASLRGLSLETVGDFTSQNAVKLFSW
jgi:TatD DNase family protein